MLSKIIFAALAAYVVAEPRFNSGAAYGEFGYFEFDSEPAGTEIDLHSPGYRERLGLALNENGLGLGSVGGGFNQPKFTVTETETDSGLNRVGILRSELDLYKDGLGLGEEGLDGDTFGIGFARTRMRFGTDGSVTTEPRLGAIKSDLTGLARNGAGLGLRREDHGDESFNRYGDGVTRTGLSTGEIVADRTGLIISEVGFGRERRPTSFGGLGQSLNGLELGGSNLRRHGLRHTGIEWGIGGIGLSEQGLPESGLSGSGIVDDLGFTGLEHAKLESGRSLIHRSRNDRTGTDILSSYIMSPQHGDFKVRNSKRGPLGGGIDNIASADPVVGIITRLTTSRISTGGTRQVIIGSPLGRYEQSQYYAVIPTKGHIDV